jgi:plasmid replication initiation protein
MSNEVIRTHNDINSLNFGGFEAVDYDVFFALCVKLRNQGDKRVTLSSDELRQFIGYKGKDKKDFARALISTNDKLLSLRTKIYDEGVVGFNVFQAYYVPKDAKEITVLFSEPARYLITDSVNKYIHTRWDEYKQMTTAYSRRLYILLKQWRTAGGHKWRVKDWRSLMGIPASYKMGNIDQRVINPARRDFEAAGCFVGLKIIKTKEDKGNRITHIEFSFKSEQQDVFPELRENAHDKKSKAEKIADIEAKEAAGTATPEMTALKDTITEEYEWMIEKDYEQAPAPVVVSDDQISFSASELFFSDSQDETNLDPVDPLNDPADVALEPIHAEVKVNEKSESTFRSILRRVFGR